MSREVHPDTYAVRGGLTRSAFDETSEALYLSSGFVYGTAQEAEAAFNEEVDRFVYSRYGNPTVCLLYTSPSPRDRTRSRMPSSA